MKLTRSVALIAWCAITFFGVCPLCAENPESSAADVKKKAAEAVDAAKDYTAQQKEEFRKKVEAEAAELSIKIDELNRRMAEAKKDASAQAQVVMRDLEKKKQEALKRVEELRSSGAEAWDSLKRNSEKALDDLQRAYRHAAPFFK
jgi:DNA anti-recombination protein RmuC